MSVSNLKFSIKQKINISLDRFIFALGIRHIGQENAKLIARHLKSPGNFFKLSNNKNIDNLYNINGIGNTQIQSITKFFLNKTNLNVLSELEKNLKIQRPPIALTMGYW